MHYPITSWSVRALTLLVVALFMVAAAQAQPTLTIGLALGADPNGEPQYTATVTSNFNAPTVTVTYTLPAAELPISPAPSGGCLFTPGPFHLTVVCQLANLPANQAHDFVIAVHPTD